MFTSGDYLKYTDSNGILRAARLSVIIDAEIDLYSIEYDTGYSDYDSIKRYSKCDKSEWDELMSVAKLRDLLGWRKYYCNNDIHCERNSADACQSCTNYDNDPRLK